MYIYIGGRSLRAQISGGRGRPPATLGVRKIDSLGYHVVCLRDPSFSRFDTIPAFDIQTDRQTHTQTDT